MIRVGDEIRLQKDEYAIVDHLGEGSYGIVWKATRKSDNALVALKIAQTRNPVMEVEYDDEGLRAVKKSFHREIEFLKRIAKESSDGKGHFVSLLDEGVVEERPALAVNLCDCSLGQWMSRHRQSPREYPFDGGRLLEWTKQLASALVALHGLSRGRAGKKERLLTLGEMEEGTGFVFRDLKPDNVLLNIGENRLYLTDFGTVRQVTGMLTCSIACTPDWAAPECLIPKVFENRERKFALTSKADVYSLGLLAHFLAMDKYTDAQKGLDSPTSSVAFGEVGGLTTKEKAALTIRCRSLFSPGSAGKTLVPQSFPDSPDIDAAADAFVELTERMLAPLAENRPSARRVLRSLGEIGDFLGPSVRRDGSAKERPEGQERGPQIYKLDLKPSQEPSEQNKKSKEESPSDPLRKKSGTKSRIAALALLLIALVSLAYGSYRVFDEQKKRSDALVAERQKVRLKLQEDSWRLLSTTLEGGDWQKARKLLDGQLAGHIRSRLDRQGLSSEGIEEFLLKVSAAEESFPEKGQSIDQLEKSKALFKEAARASEKLPCQTDQRASIRANIERTVGTVEALIGESRKGQAESLYKKIVDLSNDDRWAEASGILESEYDFLKQNLDEEKLGHFSDMDEFWSLVAKVDARAEAGPETLESLTEARESYEQAKSCAARLPDYIVLSKFAQGKIDEIVPKVRLLADHKEAGQRFGQILASSPQKKQEALSAKNKLEKAEKEPLVKAEKEFVESEKAADGLPSPVAVSKSAQVPMEEAAEKTAVPENMEDKRDASKTTSTGRFFKQADGTVWDRKLDLAWYSEDNGEDVTYRRALQQIAEMNMYEKSGKWELPTRDELYALFDENAPLRKIQCGWPVRMKTDLIHATCNWFWASDRSGSQVGAVNLGDGAREFVRPSYSEGLFRFLPVRRR